MELARNLMVVTDEQLQVWRLLANGDCTLSNDSYVSNRPQPRAEFRYSKRTGTYCHEKIRQERRSPSLLGYAVPYQASTAYAFRQGELDRSLVKLPRLITRIEVHQGCYVELAAEVSYIGSYLKEQENSGWWLIFYVSELIKISAWILQDVNDTYRLWGLSPRCILWLGQLDGSLEIALGTRYNTE